jgi:hypothetical protein
MPQNNRYSSYLLRFRWVQNDDCPTWVATMQNTQTSQQLWFSSLDGLIEFLRAEFGNASQEETADQPAGLEP